MKNLLAQTTQFNLTPQSGGGSNPFDTISKLTLPSLISGLLTLILIVASLAFFVMLVIGGVRWILSGGDKAQTEAARSQITAALVGLVIVFSAWAIAQLVRTFFNVDIFSLTVPVLPAK